MVGSQAEAATGVRQVAAVKTRPEVRGAVAAVAEVVVIKGTEALVATVVVTVRGRGLQGRAAYRCCLPR